MKKVATKIAKDASTPLGCTIVPNWLFEEVLCRGTCAQLKVTASVIRYTLGTGHREVKLSNSFLGRCTGEGPLAVDRGIEEALERGFIARRPFEEDWAYRIVDLERFSLAENLSGSVLILNREGKPVTP